MLLRVTFILLFIAAHSVIAQTLSPTTGIRCVDDCWEAAIRANSCQSAASEECICNNGQWFSDATSCVAFWCPDVANRARIVRRQICGAVLPDTSGVVSRFFTSTGDINTEPTTGRPSPRPISPPGDTSTSALSTTTRESVTVTTTGVGSTSLASTSPSTSSSASVTTDASASPSASPSATAPPEPTATAGQNNNNGAIMEYPSVFTAVAVVAATVMLTFT